MQSVSTLNIDHILKIFQIFVVDRLNVGRIEGCNIGKSFLGGKYLYCNRSVRGRRQILGEGLNSSVKLPTCRLLSKSDEGEGLASSELEMSEVH